MEQIPEWVKKLEAKADKLRNAALKSKRQPDSPFGYRYSDFSRRMLAAGFDSVFMLLTVLPLSIYLANLQVGHVEFDMLYLAGQVDGVTDPILRKQIIHDYLIGGNRMQYFFVNSAWQLFLMFVYCMFCWSKWGATPGKMIMRLKLVRKSDGAHLTYQEGFWRCVGYIITCLTLGLGAIWMVWDKNRQMLHDKMAGSAVIAGLFFKKSVEIDSSEKEPV